MRTNALGALVLWVVLMQFAESQSDSNWIVIFTVERKPDEPYIEMRILVPAVSEGDATAKAIVAIQKKFGINATDGIQFKEASPPRGGGK